MCILPSSWMADDVNSEADKTRAAGEGLVDALKHKLS